MKPDKDMLVDSLIDLGFVEGNIDLAEIKKDLANHLGKYYSTSLKEINTSELIYDLLAFTRSYDVKLPLNFILLLKAMITIEGFGKELNPNFIFVKEAKPIVDKIIKKRSSFSYIFRNWRERLLTTSTDITSIPKETRLALRELREGHIKIKVEDPAIAKFAYEVDKSSNRITFGLIISGTLMAAAIIALAKVPPYYKDIPILTIALLIISAVFSILLLISISKERSGIKI